VDSTTILLAVCGLTLIEVAAAVAIIVRGPSGSVDTLVGLITGIVGPVVTSLLALWRTESVARDLQNLKKTNDANNQR